MLILRDESFEAYGEENIEIIKSGDWTNTINGHEVDEKQVDYKMF